jgi:hypothetical protein
LHAHRHEDGIMCTVVGEDETPWQEQVNQWRKAVHVAVASLGHRDRVYTWEAIVGTPPVTLGPDRIGILKESQDLGPVRLKPGGICMRESVRLNDLIDSSFGIRYCFPVLVSGQVETHAWERVPAVAQMLLRRACALLSLATERLWIPRSQVHQRIDGQEGLAVPATFGPLPEIAYSVNQSEWYGQISNDTSVFELPDWATSAWHSLDTEPGLAIAVDGHYEAMRLHRKHPSLAHLTYVAAIEGFGARFVSSARCDLHPECTHVNEFAGKRFRKALNTVMTNSKTSRVASIAYELRSRTGHTGALLGSEQTFGYRRRRCSARPGISTSISAYSASCAISATTCSWRH